MSCDAAGALELFRRIAMHLALLLAPASVCTAARELTPLANFSYRGRPVQQVKSFPRQ